MPITDRARESNQGDGRISWSMAPLHMHKILQSVCSTNPEGSIASNKCFRGP